VTTELATKDVTAAQSATKNLQSDLFLDELRRRGFSGTRIASIMVKVSSFLGGG
jgi:hypothetical protein